MTVNSLLNNPDREQRLLLQCLAGTQVPGPDADIDWSVFLALVTRHRAQGSVASALSRLTDLPASVTEHFAAWKRSNALALLQQMHSISEILGVLDNAGIEAIVIKGPSNLGLYDSESERHVGDIDILLCRSADTWRAIELLRAQGWQERAGWSNQRDSRLWSDYQRRIWLRKRKDMSLEKADRGALELHWRPMVKASEWPEERTRTAGRRRLRVAGHEFPALDEPHAALLMLLHGTYGVWNRLKWLDDMQRLVSRASSEQLHAFVDITVRCCAGRQIALLAELLYRLFGNDRLRLYLEEDTWRAACSIDAQRMEALIQHVDAVISEDFQYSHRTRLSVGGEVAWLYRRARYKSALLTAGEGSLWSSLEDTFSFTPSEWEQVPLPTVLHPIYPVLAPVVRPFGLLRERRRRR